VRYVAALPAAALYRALRSVDQKFIPDDVAQFIAEKNSPSEGIREPSRSSGLPARIPACF
jgi:hypothetical protein